MPTALHPRFEGTLLHIQHADDGRLWFHGGEITRLLDYPDADAAIHEHCRVDTLSFGQAEHPAPRLDLENVFRLTFASPAASAPRFATWLTHRFLPQLCNPTSAQTQPTPRLRPPAPGARLAGQLVDGHARCGGGVRAAPAAELVAGAA